MAVTKTFDQRVEIFERFLSELEIGSQQIPTRHQELIRRIYRSSTMHFDFENQKAVRNEFSNRHVRRLSEKYTGLSPKLLTRLNSIIDSPNQSMAHLAVDQGYFDQPHLINEFKLFQGVTPNEFVRRLITKWDYYEPNMRLDHVENIS